MSLNKYSINTAQFTRKENAKKKNKTKKTGDAKTKKT